MSGESGTVLAERLALQFAPLQSRAPSGHAVHKVGYRAVREARVIRQADLAGSVGGIAAFAAGWDGIGQTAERVVVQFGSHEALVTGEAAAPDAFRHDDGFGTGFGKGDDLVAKPHALG